MRSATIAAGGHVVDEPTRLDGSWRLETVDVALTALGQPAPQRNGPEDHGDLISPHRPTDLTPSVGKAPVAGETDEQGQAATDHRGG